MARPLRLEYPGAVYHVFGRSIDDKILFSDDRGREKYLSLIDSAVDRYNILVHAYCLMNNHFHLLIETPDGNLSRAVRHINGIYVQYFNRIYNRMGPLFQGRYRSSLVDKNSYLLELSRYIVLNPVRAGIVRKPDQWRWSSYRATAGLVQSPDWLTTDWLLSILGGKTVADGRKKYKIFVDQGIRNPDKKMEGIAAKAIIGNKEFSRMIKEKISSKQGLEEISRVQRLEGRPSLQDIFKNSSSIEARNRNVYNAYVQHGYTMKEIGAQLNLHYSTISHILQEEETLHPKT